MKGQGKATRYFTTRVCTECGNERRVQCAKADEGTTLHRLCHRCHGLTCAKYLRPPGAVPRDDIDEMAVGIVTTEPVTLPLNVAERIEATVILTRKGMSAPLIAARLGVSTRTIERYKREARNTGRLAHCLVDWSDKAAAA